MIEVKKSVIEHFYIEKRKTLQLYHTVHIGNCTLLPSSSGRSFLGEFSDFEEMLELTKIRKDEVQKCKACFLEENE